MTNESKKSKSSAAFSLHCASTDLSYCANVIALTDTDILDETEWERIKKMANSIEEAVSMMRRTISAELEECVEARFDLDEESDDV